MVDNAAVLGTSGRWKRLEEFGRAMNQRPRLATLDALTAADLFVVEGNSWRFRSASVRDVAYQMLTKQARAQRHAGVADAVERLNDTGRDPAETLAYHWSQAAVLTAELGSVPDVPADADVRAVRWLTSAAEHALDRQAHGAAERYADGGLGFLDARAERDKQPDELSRTADVISRVRLLVLRTKARIGARAYDGARADLDAIVALTALSTDEPATLAGWRAEALRLRGMVEHHTGHPDLAQSTLQQAVDAFRALGDRHGLAGALRSAGVVGILSGRFVDAESTLAEAYDLFSADDDRRGLAWVNQHRAWTAFVRGDVQSADQRLDEAEATFAALGDPSGLGWVRGLRGFVRFHQGRLDDAEALAGAGLRDAGERGDKWAASMMQVLLAGLRLWSGRAQDGLDLAEKARAGFRSINDRHGEMQATGPLIRALVALGRTADSQRELERAVALADSEPQKAWVSLLVAGMG